jgi:hypothetical protein
VVRRALLPVLLLFALAAAGCGKSAEEQRRDFLSNAGSVCSHFAMLQNQIAFPTGNPTDSGLSHTTRAQWGLALNQIVNYGRQETRRLRKLEPPEDLRDRFERLLDAKEAAFDDLAKGADAAKRNRVSQIAAPVNAGRAKLAQVEKLAKAVGLPACG